jgi:hypothetical protein
MDIMEHYKSCTFCQKTWKTVEDMIHDPTLKVNGYQAVFGTPEEGLFLLTHYEGDCGSTLAVEAGNFKHLYDGPEYEECKARGEGCPLHCVDINNLQPCSNTCSMAWVRVVLQHLINHEVPVTDLLVQK